MLTLCALKAISIAGVAFSASADSSVVLGVAIGILCASARIDAFFVATGQNVGAVRICQAFIGSAYLEGVARVLRRTDTFCPVVLHNTFSVGAASLQRARVLALSLNASLCQGTLLVAFATS